MMRADNKPHVQVDATQDLWENMNTLVELRSRKKSVQPAVCRPILLATQAHPPPKEKH